MLCNAYDDMSSFNARLKHQRCYTGHTGTAVVRGSSPPSFVVQSHKHRTHARVPVVRMCQCRCDADLRSGSLGCRMLVFFQFFSDPLVLVVVQSSYALPLAVVHL